ncbi:MAG TPA: PHB depolymerase family esterase [Dongiaceae bacterium]|nr:PHB depolymerase family esterase [Dongiaceae bacterium]
MSTFSFSAFWLVIWSFTLSTAFASDRFDNLCGWIRSTPGEARTVYMRHDGEWRTYRLYVPESYQPNAPLVVDFHGQSSSSIAQVGTSCWKEFANREGVVVAYPQALSIPSTWDAGDFCCNPRGHDDEGFALHLVQCLMDEEKSKLKLDPARVYAAGLSNGAAMAGKLACDHSDVFAGAQLASQSFPYTSTEECRATDEIGWQKPAFPIVEVRGKWDFIVPYYISLGWSLTARTSLKRWAGANRCEGEPQISDVCDQPGAGPKCERGQATCATYDNCEGGVAVTQCSVADDHLVYVNPQRFNLCDAAWDQFQRFPGRR